MLIIIYGLSLGGMNILFYYVIECIFLGIGVVLEFIGFFVVVLFLLCKKCDLFWVVCVIVGIILLLFDMKGEDSFDFVGVILVFVVGVCWVFYILFGKKIGN